MMNPIPQEIKSPIKIFKDFFLIDGLIIIYFYFFMSIFEDFIHPAIRLAYGIFNALIAIILVRPSRYNRGRRVGISFLFNLIKQRKVYHTDYSIITESESKYNNEEHR